jgi:hypothetical protein
VRATERVYRTSDGRLIQGEHEDAVFLAYAVGDEITDHDAGLLAVKKAPARADKAGKKPADKQTGAPQDKTDGGEDPEPGDDH